MTDPTPPHELDEVVVTGQRRRPGGTFPAGPGGGGPGGGEGSGEHQDEVEDPGTQPYQPPPHPCDNPETAKNWNADAAAASAAAALAAELASRNDGSNLSNREAGANLILGANNRVQIQPNISVGGPAVGGQIPNVYIDMTGVTPANWVGDIHNHPSGDGRLSDGEWNQFINFVSSISATNPERSADLGYLSVYVVVPDATSARGYRIYAYNRDTPYNTLGEEVNPDAQPCPP